MGKGTSTGKVHARQAVHGDDGWNLLRACEWKKRVGMERDHSQVTLQKREGCLLKGIAEGT